MNEQTMVADTLTQINNSLKTYGDMSSQTENQQLRQKLQQIRNQCETSQYELFQLAKQHQYYQPAKEATPEEINQVKSIFTNQMK